MHKGLSRLMISSFVFPGMYHALKAHIKHELSGKPKTALIVPAFEVLDTRGKIPKDKSELLEALAEKTVVGFR